MMVLDDVGFSDFGCYGSEIATPNVDRLANAGLRYNNFHTTPLCAPTRACLLTGRNHHNVGMGFLSSDYPTDGPGYTGRIPKEAGSVARVLRDSGYSTFAVGKWHLVPRDEISPAGPFEHWPIGMGFDRYYGLLRGLTDQFVPDLVRDNGFIEPPYSHEGDYHLSEDLVSQAIRMIQDQQQANPSKPFFLYFAPGAMHTPHQAPVEWIVPYRGRFDDGWDKARERRFQAQQKLGVIPPGTTLTERPSWVPAWDDLPADQRRLFARQFEVYAGFLTHTDAQIGRLVDFLTAIERLDDTVIMILSDNGAEGGIPNGSVSLGVPPVSATGEVSETILDHLDDLGSVRSFSSYGNGWAWAGNTPLRLWKYWTWLGGIRVPLIVHWPAGISTESDGQIRSQFVHAIDLMPTVLEATGSVVPRTIDGFLQQPLDGRSMFQTFLDPAAPSPRETQYFEMAGSRSIYHNGWKATTDHAPARDLIAADGSKDFDADRWSLFSLEADFSEAHDLAEEEPERLGEMVELWLSEAGRNNVLPLNDRFFRAPSPEQPFHLAQPMRERYVCYPGGRYVETPPPFWRGFTFTADVEIGSASANGMIAAHHMGFSGYISPAAIWACYMLDGRVVLAFSANGSPQTIKANSTIPKGRFELTVSYAPGDGPDGSVVVNINRETLVTETVEVAARLPVFIGYLLVGRDRGIPINDDYRPPFTFTDQIHRCIFEPRA
jgi:arylsulfatase